MLAITSAGLMANGETEVPPVETATTVQDLDRQIQLLKENIAKYHALAKNFDRKVGSLQSRDYTGARDAATLRDECLGIAEDLEAHLAKLEAQRAEMVAQQNAKK